MSLTCSNAESTSSMRLAESVLMYSNLNTQIVKGFGSFHEDDEDMEETGEEFSELVEIPFEFITY